MNILLNLLPEDEKTRLKERVRSRFVFSQMLMILFFFGLYGCMLVGAFLFLERNEASFEGTTQQLESGESRKELGEIEKKFQEVNQKVSVATLLDREHFHFSTLLDRVEKVLPPGVVLTSFSTKDYAVTLSGKALERDDMVVFEKNLHDEACFMDIDIPASAWLSPKDISFQIGFTVKKECLKTNL
jgi:Tfp pilus assembly protein PilN